MTIRSMILLNQYGDTTIEWTPEVDEKMIEIITKKMKQGVNFFIIESLSDTKKQINSVFEVGSKRKVYIDDADFDDMFKNGLISVSKRDQQSSINTIKRAKSAEEVVQNHTVGVQAMRGG